METLGSVWNGYLEKKLWDDAYAQWLASESGQEMEGRVWRWCLDNLEDCCFIDGTRISYGEMLDTTSGDRYDIVYLFLNETVITDPYDRYFVVRRLFEEMRKYDLIDLSHGESSP